MGKAQLPPFLQNASSSDELPPFMQQQQDAQQPDFVKKKETSSTDLVTGTDETSLYKSPSPSPLPSLDLNAIANLATKQEQAVANILNPFQQFDPNAQKSNAPNWRVNKILQGDVGEIANTIKKEREIIKARRDVLTSEFTNEPGPSAMGLITDGGPQFADDTEKKMKELDDYEAQMHQVQKSAAQKINQEYATKLNEYNGSKLMDGLKNLGDQRRNLLSQIGEEQNYKEEGDNAALALKDNVQYGFLPGRVWVDGEKYRQEHEYMNVRGMLDQSIDEQAKQLNRLAGDSRVQLYLNGNAEQQTLLKDDPTVQQFVEKRDRYDYLVSTAETLPLKYPLVKYQIDKQRIADAYAVDLVNRNKATDKSMLGGVGGRQAIELVAGDYLQRDESEIKAIAKATGLTEDDVRRHAEQDNIGIPSYLGRTWAAATGVFQTAGQGLNRTVFDRTKANLLNKGIEETIYKNPEAYDPGKWSADNIFDNMSSGFGQFIGFVALSELAGAPVKAAIKTGEYIGAAGGYSAGELISGAGKIAADATGGEVAGSAEFAAQQEASKLVNALQKSRVVGETFATGFYSSYEQAYQYAATQTDDENLRHQYAASDAAANGLSELVFREVDFAEKVLKGVPVSKVLDRMASTRIPFSVGDVFKARIAEFAKILGYESAEELIPYFVDLIQKDNLFGYKTSASQILQGAFDTVVQTAISTVPMAGLSIRTVPTSEVTHAALYEAAKHPEIYRNYFEGQSQAGNLSDQEKNSRIQLVNTLADIQKSIPQEVDGKPLSEHRKSAITAILLSQRQLIEARKQSDPSFYPQFDRKLAEIDQALKGIINKPDAPPVQNQNQPGQPEEQKQDEVNIDDILQHVNTFAQFQPGQIAADQQQPEQPQQPETKLGQTILDRNNITADQVNDDQQYTVIVPNQLGGLGNMVGAQITAVGDKNTQVSISGTQLKELVTRENQKPRIRIPVGMESNQQQQQQVPEQQQQQRPENQLGQTILDRNNITADQVNDQSRFTVMVPNQLGSLATMVGAEVIPLGDKKNSQVNITGAQLLELLSKEKTNQYATLQSQGQEQKGTQQSGVGQYSGVIQGQQGQTQVQKTQPITNDSNRIRGGGTQEETVAPPLQDKPRIRVQVGADGSYQIVNNANTQDQGQQIDQGSQSTLTGQNVQANQQTDQSNAGTQRAQGIFNFGPVLNVAPGDLQQSPAYRKGRPFLSAAQHAAEVGVTKPILAYVTPDGRHVILDGRARALGAIERGQGTVPVRYFKGTPEQAKQVAELLREKPSRTLARERADRVQSRDPESFHENVLQAMLSALRTGKPAFSLNDFKRYIAAVQSNNPYRLNFGKQTKELSQLIRTKIIGVGGQHLDLFVQDWLNAGHEGDEQDLINELVDLVNNNQSKEDIINRLEELQGLPLEQLKNSAIPLRMTDEEAIYVASHNLNNVIEDIVFNAEDSVELTQEEQDLLQNSVVRNSDPDGGNLNMDAVYNEVFNSDDPIAQSLAQKLANYATTTEQSTRNTRSNEVLAKQEDQNASDESLPDDISDASGWQSTWDSNDTPFSRAVTTGVVRLTARQGEKIAKALARAFRGIGISVDRKDFSNAVKDAMKKSGMSLEAQGLIDQLQKAQDVFEAAERAFNNKRKELNATIAADQQDLFGNRQSQAGNKLFDERANTAAREQAIKPFKERLDVARKNVNTLQTKLNNAMKGGTQQGAMFSSKDGNILGMVIGDTVYLNPDAVRADTPMHEIGGHVLISWAQAHDPAIFNRIMELAATAPQDVIDFVTKNYPELAPGSQAFHEEVFATSIGWDERNLERGQKFLDGGWKEKLTGIWNDFINFLIDHHIIEPKATFNVSDVYKMTLSDFSNFVGHTLFAGRRLSASDTNIRAMGSDYSLLGKEDFNYDNYGNIIGVKAEVRHLLIKEKQRLKGYLGSEDRYMRTPTGELSDLTEDQWLTTHTQRFQDWSKNKPSMLHSIIEAMAKTEIEGFFGQTFKDMVLNPSHHADLISTLIDQYGDSPNVLANIVGQDVVDLVAAYDRAADTVIMTDKGEPQVFYVNDVPVFVRRDGNMISAGTNTSFSNESGDARYQRIGVKSALTDLQRNSYENAVKMESENRSEQDIFLSTGWFKDSGDGKWRYELPNHNVRYLPMTNGSTSNVLLRATAKKDFMEDLGAKLNAHPLAAPDLAFTIFMYKETEGGRRLTAKAKDLLSKKTLQEKVTVSDIPRFGDNHQYDIMWENYKNEIEKGARLSAENGLTSTTFRLEEILDYPELYTAHPDLRDLKVKYSSQMQGATGSYNVVDDSITVLHPIDPAVQYITLRHEVQHALQERLGFEQGTNMINADKVHRSMLENAYKELTNTKYRLEILERISDPNDAYRQAEIEAIRNDVTTAQGTYDDLVNNKKSWLEHIYRNFAGEREAFGTENRAKLEEAVRATTMPEVLPAATAFRHSSENGTMAGLIRGLFNRMFNAGRYNGDRFAQSISSLEAKFSKGPAVNDENENFRRGLSMWKDTLELAIEYQKRGNDKRVFLTSKEFLDIFGVNSYAQLPPDILAITETIWKLNSTQAENMLTAVDKTLSKEGDQKQEFQKQLGKVKKDIINNQKLREHRESITVERPEVKAEVSSILQDIVNGRTDDEIVEERLREVGALDDAAQNRLRNKIRQERSDYENFRQSVDDEIKRATGGRPGTMIKEFHRRMLDSKFANTPAFRRLAEEVKTYEVTNKKEATQAARDIVAMGIPVAMETLHAEAAANSQFVPVLAGAIIEHLKVRKDADTMQRVLEVMYDYTHQAGLNLNMVGAFYHMLGMADAAGKINFFMRVKNRFAKNFYAKMNATALNSKAFQEVRDTQAQVFERARGDATFAKRIEKLIKNLKDC